MNEPRLRVLSIQSPLLGNATYGQLLRRLLATSSETDFRAVWADDEQRRRMGSRMDRLLYRLCFAHIRSRFVRERNADFFALRYELGASYWAQRLLARERRSWAPQVLHFNTQGVALLSGVAMRRIPSVITGDMTSRLTADQFTRAGWRWTHALAHLIEGRTLCAAAALAPFSRYAAASIVRDYGVSESKVTVIPPGVDLPAFGDVGVSRATRMDAMRRVLFIGGEFERKGGHVLVKAFLEAFGEREDVELHLVTASETRVPRHPRIIVHSNITAYSHAWLRLYEQAMVLALPSLREAYGLVYLEAAAARLPVIGSNVGAGRELVDHGRTGLLVAPGDVAGTAAALRTLIDDPTTALRFGVAGRERVEREHDAARNARRLEDVFARVALPL